MQVDSNSHVSSAVNGGGGSTFRRIKGGGGSTFRRIKGGGAAEHMINVAGNMGQQQAGADGSIAYKQQTGGFGLTESLVPVVLVLANTKVSKNWLRNSGLSGKTLKKGLSIGGSGKVAQNDIATHVGGNLANVIVVPASLVRAKNYMGKQLRKTVKQTMNSRLFKKSRRHRSANKHKKSKRRG